MKQPLVEVSSQQQWLLFFLYQVVTAARRANPVPFKYIGLISNPRVDWGSLL
jgi:hypothetical protein